MRFVRINNRLPRRSAMTMVEVLAVVIILGIAAALVGRVALPNHEMSIEEAARSMMRLDAQGRLLAEQLGPLPLRHSPTENVIELAGLPDYLRPIRIDLPSSVSLRIESSGRSVWYDRLGHSIDYQVTFEQAERVIILNVSGLTGWIERGSPS